MPILVKSQENFSKRSGKSQEKFLSMTCGNHEYISNFNFLTVGNFKNNIFFCNTVYVSYLNCH